MPTLTSKQKRQLSSQAHHLNAIITVGQNGVSQSLIKQFNLDLEAHELVKVHIAHPCKDERQELASQLRTSTQSQLVQKIGKKFTFFRPSHKKAQRP